MLYTLHDTEKAAPLFAGWEDTMITSCLQKVMGKVLVTDTVSPVSALAHAGCFVFLTGQPERELAEYTPKSFTIFVPQNAEWAELIRKAHSSANQITRYAIRKDTRFDTVKLECFLTQLPEGYTIHKIDSALYDMCLEKQATEDFVICFGGKENYLRLGRGFVILKNGEIVSGASSYSRYNEGIEIEVDTVEGERRKHLATIACAALILDCLKDGLYPSWDAANMASVHLAETLGYEMGESYTAYALE